MCLVQCCPDRKASLIDQTKSENVTAKSGKVELTLKKELMSPQKPAFCSKTALQASLSLPMDQEFFSKDLSELVLDFFFTKLLIPKKYVLLARSIMADGSGKEMMEKENNILIDETRTDLRQGFQRIHSSSSFVPHLSFHLWLLIIRRFQNTPYF